jgi:hypothetical protein
LSHSITAPGKLEIPLEIHGVILTFHTWLLTDDKIECYQAGEFHSIELMEDVPWELYSTKFTDREVAARAA